MESNAHRRSLGVLTLDPASPPVQFSSPPVLASLVVSKRKKRLVPAVEGKKRAPKKKKQ
jgi:hypothetical protein